MPFIFFRVRVNLLKESDFDVKFFNKKISAFNFELKISAAYTFKGLRYSIFLIRTSIRTWIFANEDKFLPRFVRKYFQFFNLWLRSCFRYRSVAAFKSPLPAATIFRPKLPYRYLTVSDRHPYSGLTKNTVNQWRSAHRHRGQLSSMYTKFLIVN